MNSLLKAADAMAEALRRRLNEKVDQNVECDCSYCMAYRADEALLSAYEAAKRERDRSIRERLKIGEYTVYPEDNDHDDVVDAVIAANPDKVAQAQAKPTLIGWFVGQVMKASGGKANPQEVNELLKAKLAAAKEGKDAT